MTDLLPCPFCGAKPYERWEDNPNGPKYPGHHFVWCENLDCTASPESMEETKDAAHAAWNTRAHLPDLPQAPAILEASEGLNGHQMMTVRSERGAEYVINADAAVKAVAQLLSNYDNEQRHGWNLLVPWFEHEIAQLRTNSLSRPHCNPTPSDADASAPDQSRNG